MGAIESTLATSTKIRPSLTHAAIYVWDLPRMAAFYETVLGLERTDEGRATSAPVEFIFFTNDSSEHHQFVLVTGRPKDVSFSVAAGEAVAVVGASGSGKSTTIGLIAAFAAPQTGRVLVDGIAPRAEQLWVAPRLADEIARAKQRQERPEVLGAFDLFIGVNALDYSGYPDCRPEFVAAFETLANLATRAGVEGARFHIHTPLLTLSKADIIRAGLALGLDYGLTHSCYNPDADGRPCGHCDSCVLRARGFAEAGLADPALGR